MESDRRWFRHDSTARFDPKIRAMISEYGLEGYGRWWIILETMRDSSDRMLEDSKITFRSLAADFGVTADEARRFVEDLADEFDLLERGTNCFFSSSFLARMEAWEEIRRLRSEAGKKGGIASGKARRSKGEASVKQTSGKGEAEPKQNEPIEGLIDRGSVASQNEIEKLVQEFGRANTDHLLRRFDEYTATTGKTYKSVYRTLLNWGRKDGLKPDPPLRETPSVYDEYLADLDLDDPEREEILKKFYGKEERDAK